ncbi:hypothetical protein GCM10010517_44870 [Streptosporangium fragile]|uniref:Uncharacterized protein n=1 Tax=Streptosporangium fragile TaxID=46186 RepID=A0ABN3W1S9_9ACTN
MRTRDPGRTGIRVSPHRPGTGSRHRIITGAGHSPRRPQTHHITPCRIHHPGPRTGTEETPPARRTPPATEHAAPRRRPAGEHAAACPR